MNSRRKSWIWALAPDRQQVPIHDENDLNKVLRRWGTDVTFFVVIPPIRRERTAKEAAEW